MASTPAYASSPRSIDIAQVSTANTNRDGTGTIVTVCAGVSAGTRVSALTIKATETTTAGTVRIFLSTDTGSTWRLFREVLVSAITASGTVQTFVSRIEFPDLVLTDTSDLLGAAPNNAETFNVIVHAMDL